jgi:hypothetical protein
MAPKSTQKQPVRKPAKKPSRAKAPSKAPGKAPGKRAKPRRAPMSKAADLSRAEVSIMARMADLEADTPRYQVLEAALAFKSSWIILGEHLATVAKTQLWKGWGYISFERYCSDELFITAATAKKLVRSFIWLGEEAPEYVPTVKEGRIALPKKPPSGPLPDLSAVHVLAEAKKHMDASRVPEDAYLALKQAAFDGETASALRRTLHEAIPESAKPKTADDRVRHLRRALTASVKVIDELREWDSGGEATGDDLIVAAEKLRDAIAVRLPRAE